MKVLEAIRMGVTAFFHCFLLPLVLLKAVPLLLTLGRPYEQLIPMVSPVYLHFVKGYVAMIVRLVASPGYFTTTFTNGIKLEATSTRRAGLIRFTYPSSTSQPSVVIDLANDLQRSFQGAGSLNINSSQARITMSGTYLQSYGTDNYTAFACYDFAPPSQISDAHQTLAELGTYQSVSSQNKANVTISSNSTSLSFPFAGKTLGIEAGALLQFSGSHTVLARFGVSFINTAQACANAEEEVPDWNWDSVQNASQKAWENVLTRIETNTTNENSTVVELLYSSVRRHCYTHKTIHSLELVIPLAPRSSKHDRREPVLGFPVPIL